VFWCVVTRSSINACIYQAISDNREKVRAIKTDRYWQTVVSSGLYRAHLLAVIGYSLIYISIDARSSNHTSKHSTQTKTNRRRIFLSVFIGFPKNSLPVRSSFVMLYSICFLFETKCSSVLAYFSLNCKCGLFLRSELGRIWNNLDSKFARKLCWSSTKQFKVMAVKIWLVLSHL
jgi:hypothetical protein